MLNKIFKESTEVTLSLRISCRDMIQIHLVYELILVVFTFLVEPFVYMLRKRKFTCSNLLSGISDISTSKYGNSSWT